MKFIANHIKIQLKCKADREIRPRSVWKVPTLGGTSQKHYFLIWTPNIYAFWSSQQGNTMVKSNLQFEQVEKMAHAGLCWFWNQNFHEIIFLSSRLQIECSIYVFRLSWWVLHHALYLTKYQNRFRLSFKPLQVCFCWKS